MNPSVRWRLDLAQGLDDRLHRFTDIRAVVVGGSVARGYSDAWSDLELILYWDQRPEPATRRAIMAELGAAFQYPAGHPSHDSAYLIDGFPVDVWHLTIADAEATMDAVLRGHSLALDANNVLDTIQSCIPLAGRELINGWKERVSAYPDELTVRFLERHLPDFHLRHLEVAARRDNPTAFYHTLSDVQCSLFLVLLALNRAWFPTYKWMYQALQAMPVAPEGVASRLRQMYHDSPMSAVARLRDVLTETLTLVEARVPKLEASYTEWARYGLDQAPKVYAPRGPSGHASGYR